LDDRNKFDKIFAEAVYEGLSLIDRLVAPMVLLYLENSGLMKSKLDPLQDAMVHDSGLMKSKLNMQDAIALEKGLENIFGFGAKVFEKKILDILYAKLQLNKEIEQNFEFATEVKKASELYKSKPYTTCALARDHE